MLETLLQSLIYWVTATIGDYGLFAVFALMLLESTGILIPSEAISPFAGYLVSLGKMSFLGALAAGVLGNLAGSWIAYFIGLFGGRELWLRYGRYVGVRAHHLAVAEKWFDRYGEFTVFISRCLPVVRTFISFPAGTARMNFTRFTFYTLVGCVPWVFGLTYFGYLLGENWEEVGAYLHYVDYAVALGLVGGASTFSCAGARPGLRGCNDLPGSKYRLSPASVRFRAASYVGRVSREGALNAAPHGEQA